LEWGLINEVVPLADLDAAVDRLVQKILKNAPLAVRATKQCVQMGAELTLSQAILRQEDKGYYPAIRKLSSSPDMLEGLTAFAERRPPNWTGKAGDET
jgi:crotonobetainyl-CoA hydratase